MTSPDTLSNIGVVHVSSTAPIIGYNGDLWFNTTTKQLSVSENGLWVGVGGGGGASAPEVHIGIIAPTGVEKIWIDTSAATTVARYLIGGVWDNGIDGGRW